MTKRVRLSRKRVQAAWSLWSAYMLQRHIWTSAVVFRMPNSTAMMMFSVVQPRSTMIKRGSWMATPALLV